MNEVELVVVLVFGIPFFGIICYICSCIRYSKQSTMPQPQLNIVNLNESTDSGISSGISIDF